MSPISPELAHLRGENRKHCAVPMSLTTKSRRRVLDTVCGPEQLLQTPAMHLLGCLEWMIDRSQPERRRYSACASWRAARSGNYSRPLGGLDMVLLGIPGAAIRDIQMRERVASWSKVCSCQGKCLEVEKMEAPEEMIMAHELRAAQRNRKPVFMRRICVNPSRRDMSLPRPHKGRM